MVKPTSGLVNKRRKQWQCDDVEVVYKEVDKDIYENMIDDLALLFYTFAVNQTAKTKENLCQKVLDENQEAA